MRIVIDLQGAQSLSRHRGIGRYSVAMAKAVALAAENHEVWLALNRRHAKSAVPLLAEFDGVVSDEKIQFCDLPEGISGLSLDNQARADAAQIAYGRFLEELKPDCVWHSSLFEGWADDFTATIGGGSRDASHVATLYDLIPLLHASPYLSDPVYQRWYFQRLALVKRCGLLLALSRATQNDLVEHLEVPAEKIAVVYGAADSIFKPTPASAGQWARWTLEYGLSPEYLLYVGGYDAHKNLDNLILGYADLPADLRERHQLVLAGNCPPNEQDRITVLARRSGISVSQLIFTGGITDQALAALYSECILFVSPSLREGLGLPALEAMACGAPVIAANSSSLAELVAWREALFDPRSRGALTAKMHGALSDPDYRMALRENGAARSANFTWSSSARLALDAIEAHFHKLKYANPSLVSHRPKLVYLSPLPPARSGIADYSARILRELSSHYDIELVIDQPMIVDSWLSANFRLRSIQWFEENAEHFERRLYHFGNSPFHAHMFGLLGRYPGIVMLHDSWLGAVRNWMEEEGGDKELMDRIIYQCHGYRGLIHENRSGRKSVLDDFPMNLDVISGSYGVLVHSNHAVEQAVKYYGKGIADLFKIVPFPRRSSHGDRHFIRRMLKVEKEDFIVCSFGMLAPTKLNHRLLQAWLASPLASDPRCRLFFVGENHGGDYGDFLVSEIEKSDNKRISITGYVSAGTYSDYLAACDVAVQLRTHTRGETSAAIFDVLAQGLPLIANAHGSAAELPNGVACLLPDDFCDEELMGALSSLREDASLRRKLAQAAVGWVAQEHHPVKAAAAYAAAIEGIMAHAPAAGAERLRGQLVRNVASAQSEAVHRELTILRERARSAMGLRRIYVDVSAIAVNGLHTGIERVVREVLRGLWEFQQMDWRIEPVRLMGSCYVYATDYATRMLGLSASSLPADEVVPARGDILFGLDWVADRLPVNRDLLESWRTLGVRMVFVVYDLLPVLAPRWFPPGIAKMHEDWLACIGTFGDGLISISRTVAEDLHGWYELHKEVSGRATRQLGFFHPGGDFLATTSNEPAVRGQSPLPDRIVRRDFFLMVGTLEPRKGHATVLDVFDRLWREKRNTHVLVIVGRQGWMSDDLVSRIRQHPEFGVRLIWLEQVDDETLEIIYRQAKALIAASEAEGFGLPLVEAARRRLPVVARDIPVFREVSSGFAEFFDGKDPDGLFNILQHWDDRTSTKYELFEEVGDWTSAMRKLWDMLVNVPDAPWLEFNSVS